MAQGAPAPVNDKKITEDFSKAMELVRANYVEAKEYEDLTKTAIQGMLHQLDPHSDYMDPKGYREFNDKQHSRYFGIGSYITTRLRQTFVTEPFKDSPAYRAGIRYGDQIVAVDGKDTSKWTSDKVRELLLGERGTRVTVTVQRPSLAEPKTFQITRDGIALPSIPNFYMVKPGIGYIGLTRNFQSTTTQELVEAIAMLREKGATQFILDLRGNGGGYLDQGIRVADKLLQRGQSIVSVRGRNRNNDQSAFAEMGASDNFPLVVLINNGSASASEIVAGAIQDHDRGLIVGETSFGKGLVQRIFPMQNSGALVLTIAHYYTPSGRLIQRDYSNSSLIDYYNKRNFDPNVKKGEMKLTDTGRQMYGGGGIEPDIKLGNADDGALTTTGIFEATFLFTRELVNGQVPGFANYKLGSIDFDSKLKGSEFQVSDDLLKAWQTYLLGLAKDYPGYGLTQQKLDESKVWARKFIRSDVLLAAYGTDRRDQVVSDLDLQLQRAIQELPNAAALAEKARARNNAMNRR
ncbi:MAG: S41 family peptidase [Acidobacteria bacterium]|nr:S41 family peptidase [Acidobacteriota bacterium]